MLIPVLKDFFKKHPLTNLRIFLGDAAFDSMKIYKSLLQDASFEKTYIPLSGRLSLPKADCPFSEYESPCCPKKALLFHEAGSAQIPSALWTSYHEVCILQDKIGLQQNG